MNKVVKKTLLILMLSADMIVCQSQVNTAESQQNLNALGGGSGMFRSFDNRYKGIQGGLMLQENFVSGKIQMSKGQLVKHERINYDAYNDELVVLMKDDREAVVNTLMVINFVLNVGADTLHFSRLLRPDGKIGFFLKMSNSGNILFYKRVYKTLAEPSYKGAYSVGRDYAEFVPEQKYFFLEKGWQLKEFKNRKSFVEQFPDHEEALESFIKKEKIDFKNDDDLRRLFKYLNEIRGG